LKAEKNMLNIDRNGRKLVLLGIFNLLIKLIAGVLKNKKTKIH
jgi:hypothetical protein